MPRRKDIASKHRAAPGKINLGLHVLRKRPDGYHDIETVFVRIPWSDVLHASPADDLLLTCSDPSLPVDASNLVIRAACELLAARTAPERGDPRTAPAPADPHIRWNVFHPGGARLHLDKHLPMGAGLGGGSSDAAAALMLLNDLWDLQCTREELSKIAERLGSDVPFFLGPEAAFGSGRGEILEPLLDPKTSEPYRPPFALVVAVPPVQVPTARAYSLIRPRPDGRPDLREIVLSSDLERWQRELVNDFEGPIFEAYPAIRETKLALLRAGAGYASLSGSGAAVYGFFEDDHDASGGAEALRGSGHAVWHGEL